ncbi:MAG: PEP-CTERM sorting domain-containing protein, partial [Thermoguttaceae bacterium]
HKDDSDHHHSEKSDEHHSKPGTSHKADSDHHHSEKSDEHHSKPETGAPKGGFPPFCGEHENYFWVSGQRVNIHSDVTLFSGGGCDDWQIVEVISQRSLINEDWNAVWAGVLGSSRALGSDCDLSLISFTKPGGTHQDDYKLGSGSWQFPADPCWLVDTIAAWKLDFTESCREPPFKPGPDHGCPDYGCPDYGCPDHGCPDYGCPDHGYPDHGCPDHGCPDHGCPDHGDHDHKHHHPPGGDGGCVPEPATIAIWGLGIGLAGAAALRRRKQPRRRWSEENRQAILDIIEGKR